MGEEKLGFWLDLLRMGFAGAQHHAGRAARRGRLPSGGTRQRPHVPPVRASAKPSLPGHNF